MLPFNHSFSNLINTSANKKINIYFVTKDGYHNENKVLMAVDVEARVTEKPDDDRSFRPDKNFGISYNYYKLVYIPVQYETLEIFDKLKYRDIIEIDGNEHRIVNIYKGYDTNGNLNYVKVIVV